MSTGEGFLTRWSRRKRAEPEVAPTETSPAAGEDVTGQAVAGQESVGQESVGQLPAVVEPEVDLAALPSIDELDAGSDISAFLAKGVPQALRNAAMRRMWSLDETLRHPDTLAEYAWNFNDPNSMIGFGEIDESVDRVAMLRQVMGEVPDPPPVEAGQEALDAASPESMEIAANQPDSALENGAEDEAVADGSAGESDAPEPAESEVASDVATHNQPVEIVSETLPTRNRPRHGGALPE
jgi:hypothetical protein